MECFKYCPNYFDGDMKEENSKEYESLVYGTTSIFIETLKDDENMIKYQITNTQLANEIIIDEYFYSEYANSKNVIPQNDNASIQVNLNKQVSKKDFTKLEFLGEGCYGKVYLVKNLKDDKLYAMKIIDKRKLKSEKEKEHLNSELQILEEVKHPFLIDTEMSFENEKKIYIISHYYSGGELFYHMRKYKKFSPELAKFYIAQIVLAIDFLHRRNIIYRDLKPENIVLESDGYLKITDFGLAKDIKDDERTKTFCGTNEYLAPEVVLGDSYGKPVDIWGMGILLYEMIVGNVKEYILL